MPDVRGLLSDPEFNALPMDRRKAILSRINPQLAEEYGGTQAPKRKAGDMPYYDVPLPDPGVVAATAPIALAPAGIGAMAGMPLRAAATTGAKVAGELGGGYVADRALAAIGVPSEVRAALLTMYGVKRLSGAGLGKRIGAAMRGEPASVAAKAVPIPSIPRGASTTGTPSAATIPNVRVSTGSAPAAVPAAKAATAAPEVLPEAATFHGDKIWRVGDRVFTNAKDALQHSHTLKRSGTAAKVTAPTTTKAPEAATTVAKAAPAASGAARQSALLNVAKEAAMKNPKVGEKIWVLLDKNGDAVKVLTPDQAGAAKRAGEATTWVRNLWSKGL